MDGLAAGTDHAFELRAANAEGAGDAAAAALDAAVPGAPGNLQAETAPAQFTGAIALTWQAPPDNARAITKYQVRRKAGTAPFADGHSTDLPPGETETHGGPGTVSGTVGGTVGGTMGGTVGGTVGHTVSGLDDATQYRFQVRAVNGEGEGAASGTATATTAAGGTAPNLSAAKVGGGGLSVVLTFDEALEPSNVPTPAAFTVTVTAGGGGQARTPATLTFRGSLPGLELNLAAEDAIRLGETVIGELRQARDRERVNKAAARYGRHPGGVLHRRARGQRAARLRPRRRPRTWRRRRAVRAAGPLARRR